MEFQQRQPHFKLDAVSASVISAWENSQRIPHPPVHRPSLNYNNFPISPLSPSSSPQSASSSMTVPSANSWTPASLSEFEMLQLRRGLISAAGVVADREPSLPTGATLAAAANHRPFSFDFDFSLPHFDLALQRPPSSHNHHHHQQQRQLQQQRCSPPLPTPTTPTSSSTIFSSPPVSPESNMSFRRQSPSSSSTSSSSLKRSPSEDGSPKTTTGTKKPRACMSVKDFVPPDVSGLSKREARLVKNRAAAFLSRQRKREEFELMEIHVQELEQENAHLRDVVGGASISSSESDASELEILRIQLAAARQRETELSRRLESLQQEQQIKTEMMEPVLCDGSSSGDNSPYMAAGSPLRNIAANPKGGASLGLMVLLCALPSLLSQPTSHPRSTLPTSHSFLDTIQWDAPSIFPTTASTSDEVPSWELDFSGSSTGINAGNAGNMAMDIDYGNFRNGEEEREWQKLELGLENDDLGGLGLGALDVSFATRRTKDGKIRVRVHSSPSTSTSASAPASENQMKTEDVSSPVDGLTDPAFMSFSLPSPAQSQSSLPSASSPESGMNPLSLSLVDTDPLGPFLGAGPSPTGVFELGSGFDFSDSGLAGSHAVLDGVKAGEKRRVRIALRSLPQPGGEGGEWEVEVR